MRPDSNVIDMTQRRMRQCAVASPSFIASLVDAIDTEREIAEIEPDPGPSAQWWDKLDLYHRGRQLRNDRRPADPGQYFLAGTYTGGNAWNGNASKTASHKPRDLPTRGV